MQNDTPQSLMGITEIERLAPAGVLDLLALYEQVENIYINATIASSTAEVQMTTGNSTNFPLQRGT